MFHPKGPTFLELARQALSSTDRGYDLLAPKFEYTPFRTPDVVLNRSLRDVGEVDSAVDLCCGTGAAMGVLQQHARRVVGIDRSEGMLREANRRITAVFLHSDVLNPPAERLGEFDLATCYGAFGHILEEDEPRLVRAVHKLLKPEGRFVFVTADEPTRWSVPRLAARTFNAAMRLRNALISPPFIMYYLTFLLPRATQLLEAQGFFRRG